MLGEEIEMSRDDDLILQSDFMLRRSLNCVEAAREMTRNMHERLDKTAARVAESLFLIKRSDEAIESMEAMRGTRV